MQPVTLGAVLALLLSGRVYANEELVRDAEVIEGDSLQFSVVTIFHLEVVKCFLEPPQSDIIEFEPDNVNQSTDRFEVINTNGDIMSRCRVEVKNIDKIDQGNWTMYYEHPGGRGQSQRYIVAVLSRDVVTTEPSVFEGSTKLSEIEHFTRKNSLIDISLNKESFEEECYVVPPKGVMTKADIPLDGVTVQSKSDFVSCRITIGPMIEGLLGQWGLCGKSKVDESLRCQPADISWNSGYPDAYWETELIPRFNHPVHFGGSVNPGVSHFSDAITCHVVTPNGEDLVLTEDVHYPNIERVHSGNPGLCSVLIKVIDERSLGEWTVYGKFRSSLSGWSEVRLPMNFTLYNALDPYEQAYNVTVLPKDNRVVNLGSTIEMEVTGSSLVNQCKFRTPTGHVFYSDRSEEFKGVSFVNVDDKVACRIAIGPITKEMVGQWELIGKFNHGNLFDEKVQIFDISIEDPENPIEDEDRVVVNLPEQRIETSMGALHKLTIATAQVPNGESCYIITPNGNQYTLMKGFNIDGVEIIEDPEVQCGVTIHLKSTDLIGEWVLFARGIRSLLIPDATEWRMNFTIYVEEQVNAVPKQVNMAEGTNLYVRLEKPTDLFETCQLTGPEGTSVSYEIDQLHINSCGYIVKNVSREQSGKWMIVYENRIVYRAVIVVNVSASSAVSAENQIWTLGTPVNTTIGPEDAVYCRLVDASGLTMFDSFGRCVIDIERVTLEHQGVWRMSIGTPGTVLLQETAFIVDVNEAVSSPVVTTSVVRQAPSVLLTCSVPSEYEVKGCKFRDHRGNIMLAHHGVGQDLETGAVATSFESEVSANSCTLRLTNPTATDLGLWRCAVDTADETLYAFLNVTCPWLMQNPEVVAAVVLEPTLAQERTNINSLEGDSTVMSCAIDASIRYCYFRARNGSIFNLRPGHQNADYEYVGAGFHAGDCGIRFKNLLASDSGRWSCHVGLFDTSAAEHRGQFEVEVKEKMTVSHYRDYTGQLVLEGAVYNNHRVEYCRYIRIDGLGFTSDNVPEGYSVNNALMNNGYCTLVMAEPTMLNMHPWTVVAKLAGVDQEIAKYSVDHLMVVEGPVNGPEGGSGSNNFSGILLWIGLAMLFLTVATVGFALVPKKNREWTYGRASALRNSITKVPFGSTQNTPPAV